MCVWCVCVCVCVSGDIASVKFFNPHFCIATCEGINVLRGCLHCVFVVKIHVKHLPKRDTG